MPGDSYLKGFSMLLKNVCSTLYLDLCMCVCMCVITLMHIIIVQDADKDTVRCRWASGALSECGGICNAFPNASLDSVITQY